MRAAEGPPERQDRNGSRRCCAGWKLKWNGIVRWRRVDLRNLVCEHFGVAVHEHMLNFT